MDRPTRIIVEKLHDKVKLTCMDELSGSAAGIDLPINGYKALGEHFKTGVMDISSDDIDLSQKNIYGCCPECLSEETRPHGDTPIKCLECGHVFID